MNELIRRKEIWNITHDHAPAGLRTGSSSRCATTRRSKGRRAGKTGTAAARVLGPNLVPTTDWAEVNSGGVIEAFTIVCDAGWSNTALGGYLRGIDMSKPPEAAKKMKIGTG